MRFLVLFLLLISFNTYSQTQVTSNQVLQSKQIMERWGFKSDYMKFSNGIVVSIPRMALIKSGVKFPPFKTNIVVNIVEQFKVLDVNDYGCRVEPVNIFVENDNTPDNDIFIVNFNGYSGRMYGPVLLYQLNSDFEYNTVSNTRRIIPKFEMAVKATKSEMDEFIKNNTK